MSKRYAVSVEVCHVLTRADADKIAAKIRGRLNDLDEDIYICIADYEQVKTKVDNITSIQASRLEKLGVG